MERLILFYIFHGYFSTADIFQMIEKLSLVMKKEKYK